MELKTFSRNKKINREAITETKIKLTRTKEFQNYVLLYIVVIKRKEHAVVWALLVDKKWQDQIR